MGSVEYVNGVYRENSGLIGALGVTYNMNINTNRQFTVPPHAGYRLVEVNIKSIDKGDPSKGVTYPASVSLV